MTMTLPWQTDILEHMPASLTDRLHLHLLDECESTNAALLERAEQGAASGSVLIARHQTAGRGRRGRQWISAPGDSLTFSLLWHFSDRTNPAGLSLAAGLAAARAIQAMVAAERSATVQLKWPNDILLAGKKLGGILVELLPGKTHVAVIGIGINLRLPEVMPAAIRTASTALEVRDAHVNLLPTILTELLAVLDQFGATGFTALRNDWLGLHAHQDLAVRLLSDFAPPCDGICRGVDVDGALLLDCDGHIERILSGEVSLRATA